MVGNVITELEAAAILGCAPPAVRALVAANLLAVREVVDGRRTFDRAAVEKLAQKPSAESPDGARG